MSRGSPTRPDRSAPSGDAIKRTCARQRRPHHSSQPLPSTMDARTPADAVSARLKQRPSESEKKYRCDPDCPSPVGNVSAHSPELETRLESSPFESTRLYACFTLPIWDTNPPDWSMLTVRSISRGQDSRTVVSPDR